MNKVLIIGEHDGKSLNPAAAKCVTCATAIPDSEITHCASSARIPPPWSAQAAALAGVKTVLRIDQAGK